MAESYRELLVWHRAIELSLALYGLTREFPPEEIYGLASQLRRAGVSVASNIAEGYGRDLRADFRKFLRVARGSALEIQTQLFIARRLGYGSPENLSRAESLSEETSKMLWAMIQKM